MSRSCRDCLKTIFQEEKNTDMNAIKHATQTRSKQHFKSLKNISHQEKCQAFRSKHTHTHKKKTSLTNFYFRNKSRQFSDYTLTHVFLVMAKSHCTYTCIKSSKEYYVLCVKNITRLHKCMHVMTI